MVKMVIIEYFKKLFISECYIRTKFGIYCPGCGGTRAFTALLHGDIIKSLKYNPITLFFFIDLILMLLIDLYKKKFKKYKIAKFRLWINIVFLAYIIVYFLYRNFMLLIGYDLLGN